MDSPQFYGVIGPGRAGNWKPNYAWGFCEVEGAGTLFAEAPACGRGGTVKGGPG